MIGKKIKITIFVNLFLVALGTGIGVVQAVELGNIEPIPGSIGDTSRFGTSAGLAMETIMSTIVGFLTTLSGLYFFVYFILGGMAWITAGEDKTKIENARNKMTNAAIGLTIVVAAYSVVYIVSKVLGVDFLNLNTLIRNYLSPSGRPGIR